MEIRQEGFHSIDEYIATFPADIQVRLEAVRATIKAAAPDATEGIGYQMPTFVQHGNLVYFAAAKQHLGFYPTSSGIAAFKEELSNYDGAKGSVKFPYSQPIPHDLITKIVQFRVAENCNKATAKARKKKA